MVCRSGVRLNFNFVRKAVTLLESFVFKKLLQSAQFADESRTLRHRRCIGIVCISGRIVAGMIVGHDAAPAAKREDLPCLATGGWEAALATRANTSSRGPNAIERPSYTTIVMFNT